MAWVQPPCRETDAPTREEVIRDFLVFYVNHNEERLFRHDIFNTLMSKLYEKQVSTMTEALNMIRSYPCSLFCILLRECRNVAMKEKLLSRDAIVDLHELIDYSKQCE